MFSYKWKYRCKYDCKYSNWIQLQKKYNVKWSLKRKIYIFQKQWRAGGWWMVTRRTFSHYRIIGFLSRQYLIIVIPHYHIIVFLYLKTILTPRIHDSSSSSQWPNNPSLNALSAAEVEQACVLGLFRGPVGNLVPVGFCLKYSRFDLCCYVSSDRGSKYFCDSEYFSF